MNNSEKISTINRILSEFFANPRNPRVVKAKDMMDEFVRNGVFNQDIRNGLPLRDLLRSLDEINQLDKIPYLMVERKSKNRNWFFVESKVSDNIDKSEESGIIKCLPPIVDNKSEILILGTAPGEESLAKGEYYASSKNSFWKIISSVFNKGIPFRNYQEKIDCLHRNHIALWDVYASCNRRGSLDSNIRDYKMNDLRKFISDYPINLVLLNSRDAETAFRKMNVKVPYKYVTSSSNSNPMSLEDKKEEWGKAFALLYFMKYDASDGGACHGVSEDLSRTGG